MGALPRPGSAAHIRSSVQRCGTSGIPALPANAGRGTVAGGACATTPPELALVVPCYNEAARLDPEAFLQFAAAHPNVRLLMIDDGSVDATPDILARMCTAAPESAEALRKPSRSGKAEAVRTGILAGIERGAELVGFLDADLSTLLRAIDDFLAVLRGRPSLEFILGSRVMLLGRDVRRKTTRHYMGRVFAMAVSHALDLPVYDTQCGARYCASTRRRLRCSGSRSAAPGFLTSS